jgi:protein-S-isoprenylcysteine O-methyltransferase Ste14
MFIVGGGWLVILPECILYLESPGTLPEFRPWPLFALGTILVGLGVALALWAGYYLIEHGRGTPMPLDAPQRLVTQGPYRFVRNPQGIAMAVMVAGEVLAVKSAFLWLMIPLTVVYLEALVGPWESRQLQRNFGSEYEAYVARVPKWFPRRPRQRDG